MSASRLKRKPQVMVLGFDGLTLAHLLPLVEAGQLPTFARLLQTGAYGVLRSVTNMMTGPTWASFATGCCPNQHGVWHDFHHLAGSYTLQPTKGQDRRLPTFWQVASEAGATVIALNVPLSYPTEAVSGVWLAGIDAPGESAAGFDYPPGSYRELRRHGIDYMIDCGLASYMQAGRVAAGVAVVEAETEGRTRAAEYFMGKLDWDLVAIVYSLPDVWQHYYWTAPENTPERERLYDGYRLLDRHLARLLTHLPPEGRVIICSDHGFGPLQGTRDSLNGWLAGQGLLHYQAGKVYTPLAGLSRVLLGQIRQRMSFRRRQQLLAALPVLRQKVESRLRIGGIDWPQTKVYAALDHLELWINVRGRQPQGCVDPAAYDAVCQQVIEALLGWREPKTGLAYIKAVQRQPYHPEQDQPILLPDLVLDWNPAITPPAIHPLISGDHAPEGTLIVAGADVQPQRLPECSLIDVAPLALQALGLPAPAWMTGKVPAGL